MRERLFDLIAEAIPNSTPIDCLPDVDAIVDHLLAAGVIVPPCKVGDWVFGVVPKYDVTKGRVKYEVSDIEIKGLTYRLPDGVWTALLLVVDEKYEQCGTFGKTVFLTKEEAEKALKGRREGDV